MRRQIWPYRRPSTETVTADTWQLVLDEGPTDLPASLPHWDYRTNLSLGRQITVDTDMLRSEVRLPSDATLQMTVIWTASGSNLRQSAGAVALHREGRQKADLEVQLPGELLGGTVTLRTLLTVADPGTVEDPLAPRLSGSVLWSDEHKVRLQGDAPQFPIAIVDFTRTTFPDNASWHLELGSQLESATMGTLLLYINERSKATVQAFQRAAAPKAVDKVILDAVYADVARLMVEAALHHPDFTDESKFDEDSLGETFQNLIHSLFPGRTVADLRQLREHSPHRLSTQVQAAVGVFQES
ncbi:hypothetical protein CS0771_32300 [Catellatospora sp. IY07-71]|uniref:hypothetical protein n=1 Tax=Catellatospora sp. IY07-71 TaxID=2728827 RepID=UPI001BB3E52C|nr:hypothetical protein [Catellatospora sp. IY07-71]BCJ73686.1 hypothetical protein CS0771_32300 [Catellatospora sp. IY07-71]